MKIVKLFAWDFHGTLEQGTEVGFAEILKRLAVEIKYETKIELEEVRRMFGASVLDYLKHFFPTLSNNEILELKDKVRRVQNRKYIEKYIRSAPYAHDVLGKIKAAGHKSIIVSTSSQQHIMKFLKVVSVESYFDKVYGIDRHSLEVKFDIASEKAKAISVFASKNKIDAKNIVVIGDRSGDIDAGLLIGAKTYQYVNPDFPRVVTSAKYKISDLRKILKEI